ncbi:hypothetical protein DP923_05345 [Pontibacter arcticus]|uniref:Uncharacterized protein n=1 Tax=Pontibacter arcticus TaxID=2080288 RepID=A0A364REK9_9BACT|nr:hypothetical protein DP923_05345 [Pontibacter arcticus]
MAEEVYVCVAGSTLNWQTKSKYTGCAWCCRIILWRVDRKYKKNNTALWFCLAEQAQHLNKILAGSNHLYFRIKKNRKVICAITGLEQV